MRSLLLLAAVVLCALEPAEADLHTCTCALSDIQRKYALPERCQQDPVMIRMVSQTWANDTEPLAAYGSDIAILRTANRIKYANTYYKALANGVAYGERSSSSQL